MKTKIVQLAALANDATTTEPERQAAAMICARLVHENPGVFAGNPSPEPLPGGASSIDPLVGAVVREAATVAGDLFRDWFGRKVVRDGMKAAREAAKLACPTCGASRGAPVVLLSGGAIQRCVNGHSFIVPAPGPRSGSNGTPKPGPRRARAPRAR